MDRLTASSTAPPPDWPLPSPRLPPLINEPYENKRHCRVFHAGTVNLNLAQMTEAAEREAQKERDDQAAESTEREVERMRVQKTMQKTEKKRRNVQQENLVEQEKAGEHDIFDEMIESIDALLSSVESLSEAVPPKTPRPATAQRTSPPPPTTIKSADFEARETTITAPSPFAADCGTKAARTDAHGTTKDTTAASIAINPTTALRSHPPSSAERSFARDLSAAHNARLVAATARPETRVMQMPASALAAFDAVTQYGVLITHKKKEKKRKKTLRFAKAVVRGFRGVFGDEGRS